jgi:hypothetical protein
MVLEVVMRVRRCAALVILAVMLNLLKEPAALAEGALATFEAPRQSATGISFDRQTLEDARATALQMCQSRGLPCTVKFTFRRSCFALAYQTKGPHFSFSVRPTVGEAASVALSTCQSKVGYCEIRRTGCDTIDERQDAERRAAAARARQEAQQAEFENQQRAQQLAQRGAELDRQEAAARQARENRQAEFEDQQRAQQLAQKRAELDRQEQELLARQRTVKEQAGRSGPVNGNSVQGNDAVSDRELPVNERQTAINRIMVPITLVWIFVVIPIVGAIGLAFRRKLPAWLAASIALAVPVVTGLLGLQLGITHELTLAELGILVAPSGAGLFVTLIARA